MTSENQHYQTETNNGSQLGTNSAVDTTKTTKQHNRGRAGRDSNHKQRQDSSIHLHQPQPQQYPDNHSNLRSSAGKQPPHHQQQQYTGRPSKNNQEDEAVSRGGMIDRSISYENAGSIRNSGRTNQAHQNANHRSQSSTRHNPDNRSAASGNRSQTVNFKITPMENDASQKERINDGNDGTSPYRGGSPLRKSAASRDQDRLNSAGQNQRRGGSQHYSSGDRAGSSNLNNQSAANQLPPPSNDFTEVFSWGSDRFGQLGLGHAMSAGKALHNMPRFCSYNIPIFQMSCGERHAAFITANSLCYTMGDNSDGQLGINQPLVESKHSPVLVDSLLNFKLQSVSCGKSHTVVLTRIGDAFSWGNNDFGQCGSNTKATTFVPHCVNFDNYYRTNLRHISAGANHTAFVDDIGRLFMCGRGTSGQLGLGSTGDELTPYYVSRIPDKVAEVACGVDHTIVLSQKGEVFAMGSNRKGQLGTGSPSRGCALPTFLEELSFARMVKVRAGTFSASLSADGQLYVWGEGTFGNFYTPHRIKSAKTLDISDFQISKGGLAAVISRSGTCYTWGENDVGQLGHGDFISRQTPQRVKNLEGKKVTSMAIGDDFVIALGLTMPQKEYEKLAKNNGILKQKGNNHDRPNIRRIKSVNTTYALKASKAADNEQDQPLRNREKLRTVQTSASLMRGVKVTRNNRGEVALGQTNSSKKQKTQSQGAINLRSKQTIKKSDIQKMAALAKSGEKSQVFTPLRDKSLNSARDSSKNFKNNNDSRRVSDSRSVNLRSSTRIPSSKMTTNKPTSRAYEPMRANAQLKEVTGLFKHQEKQIDELRAEKEYVERAFSHERLNVVDKQRQCQELERENVTLRSENVRLKDHEQVTRQDNDRLRDINQKLTSEIDTIRQQMNLQEDAIRHAQSLKLQTDQMIIDYEKVKEEHGFFSRRNEEMSQELHANRDRIRQLEQHNDSMKREMESYKDQTRATTANDSREIVALQNQIRDKQRQVEDLQIEVQQKSDQNLLQSREAVQWKQIAEKQENDNKDYKRVIEDLEMKNRRLNDKLNIEIYNQAASYKENAVSTLLKQSASPRQNQPPQHSQQNQNQQFQQPNARQQQQQLLSNNTGNPRMESAFSRSPLRMQRNQPPLNQQQSNNQNNAMYPQQSTMNDSRYQKPQSYSPLRNQSKSRSPDRRTANALKDSQIGYNQNLHQNSSTNQQQNFNERKSSPLNFADIQRKDLVESSSDNQIGGGLAGAGMGGQQGYQPRNASTNNHRLSNSPLRQKTSYNDQAISSQNNVVVPGRSADSIDESYARMKKSCDRIAAVLGIRENAKKEREQRNSQPDFQQRSARRQSHEPHMQPSRGEGGEPQPRTSRYEPSGNPMHESPAKARENSLNHAHLTLGNLASRPEQNMQRRESASPVRQSKDGFPLQYLSLREKSPVRGGNDPQQSEQMMLSGGERVPKTGTQFAASMVRQSLADLRERLGAIRREKDTIEQSVTSFHQ